jgi:chromosome segregation ATPase
VLGSSEHWQGERMALISSLRDSETRLKQLLEKTNQVTAQKDQEVRDLREKNQECERRLDEIVYYKTEIQRFQGIINGLEGQIEALFSERSNLQEQLNEKQVLLQQEAQQNSSWEELTNKLRDQEKKVWDLLEKNDTMNDLLEASENRVRILVSESEKLAEALSQKNAEWETIQENRILENARFREMQDNFSRLHSQLESLNSGIENRDFEISQLHSKNSELEGARLSLEEQTLISRTKAADYENKLQLIITLVDQVNDLAAAQAEKIQTLSEPRQQNNEVNMSFNFF